MQRFYPPAEMPMGMEDSDSDEEAGLAAAHRAKPRRKAHQRPQGSDQIRQAFSKRKKGLVLKSYQLFRLTDAKVFMFVMNDKGSSWAYATPGFGAPLGLGLLRQLRDMAGVGDVAGQSKCHTEVMPHPVIADHDPAVDDRDQYVTPRGAARAAEAAAAAYVAPAPRSGRACSSFSGEASAGAGLSAAGGFCGAAADGGGGRGGGAGAAAGGRAGGPAASKSRRVTGDDGEELPRARPPSGMSINTHATCVLSGVPNFLGAAAALPPAACGGAGDARGGGAAPAGMYLGPPADSSLSDPSSLATGAPHHLPQQQQQQLLQRGAGRPAYGKPLLGASPGYAMDEVMDDIMAEQLPLFQAPQQCLQQQQQQQQQQCMDGMHCTAAAPPAQQPLQQPQCQLAPLTARALHLSQPPASPPQGDQAALARSPSPAAAAAAVPCLSDMFVSLQSRLAPLRTRLQQGWPEDAPCSQVHSAPAAPAGAALGPFCAGTPAGGGGGSGPPSDAGVGARAAAEAMSDPGFCIGAAGYSLHAYGAQLPAPYFSAATQPIPIPTAGGCTSSGGTPTVGGSCAAAAAGPFARFGGPAAARFSAVDCSTEPSPTASIGRGVAALAVDSSPCTPARPSPLQMQQHQPQQCWGEQAAAAAAAPAPGGAFYPGADLQAEEVFMDDPILAGLWAVEAQPQVSASSCGLAMQASPMPLPMQLPQAQQLPLPAAPALSVPMQQQMQQVAAQLQMLQQQQAAMQQQLMAQQQQAAMQQQVQQQMQQQLSPRSSPAPAAAAAAASPANSRERLLDALSAQISAMTPEMRAQLEMQLEASTPSATPSHQAAAAEAAGAGADGGGGAGTPRGGCAVSALGPCVSGPAAALSALTTNMLHGPSRLSATSPAMTAASDPSIAAPAAATASPAQRHASPPFAPPPPRSPLAAPAPAAPQLPDAARGGCASPLKRGAPARAAGPAAGARPGDDGGGGSPLKRMRGLPEPPSFATLVQAELGADDAMAWALQASVNGTVFGAPAQGGGGSVALAMDCGGSLVGLGSDDALVQLEDADWAPSLE